MPSDTTRVKRSRVERLDDLYRAEAPAALRLAFLMTGNRALSEDLVHDAFIRVGGKLSSLRDASAFGAYFRKTVVNLVRNHFRHQGVVRAHLEREGSRQRTTVETVDVGTQDEMWAAVQSLPLRQREVLVCRYYLDLSEQQTADTLGCSTGTVKSSASRGLSSLRAQIETGEELT